MKWQKFNSPDDWTVCLVNLLFVCLSVWLAVGPGWFWSRGDESLATAAKLLHLEVEPNHELSPTKTACEPFVLRFRRHH